MSRQETPCRDPLELNMRRLEYCRRNQIYDLDSPDVPRHCKRSGRTDRLHRDRSYYESSSG